MSAKQRTVQPTSQATPFAEDFVKVLQGLLDQGAFGGGVGPLQRQAGTAAQQFVSSGGLPPALLNASNLAFERNLADIGEASGIAGSRLGSSYTRSATRAAEDRSTQLTALGQQNLLGGINALNQIATSSFAPFLTLARQGIFPTQTTYTENPFISGIKAVGSVLPG